MKSQENIVGKMIEVEQIVRRLEKKGDFYKANLYKQHIHILRWVLED
jgi:hypothetical protein